MLTFGVNAPLDPGMRNVSRAPNLHEMVPGKIGFWSFNQSCCVLVSIREFF